MSLDQLTNQPTGNQPVANYISIRLTLAHSLKDDIIEKVFNDTDYIMYMHKPGTDNEHFHIYVPAGDGDGNAVRERYRKRFLKYYPHCRGNKGNSAKLYGNGVRSFVFYCHHEGADPIFKGDYQAIIDDVVSAGVYKKHDHGLRESSGTFKPIRERLANPQLTLPNLLKQAFKYRNASGLITRDLGKVVLHMVNNGWDASQNLKDVGIPTYDYELFAARCEGKDIEEQSWMKPHKRGERKGDYGEVDSDYQVLKRPCLVPRPHE